MRLRLPPQRSIKDEGMEFIRARELGIDRGDGSRAAGGNGFATLNNK